ncbi:MAG: hypothetical protein NVS1B14_02110 [Vulcanimicrobiaceae bacterium]
MGDAQPGAALLKAIILAGGLSTRLYPLTRQVPKPLVPVAGEPNAIHLIRYLKQYGYDEIAINVHYLADAITARLGDGRAFGVRLTYLHEQELLGSAGAVKQLESFLAGADFVVVGCDDLTDLPLDRLVQFHRDRRALATIALVRRDSVEQYGVVVTAHDGRVVEFQEKPARGTERSNLANTGIYVFTPEILTRISAGEFVDFGKDVFPALQTQGERFYGFDAGDAYWCDIGTIAEYRRASFDVADGRFTLPGISHRAIHPTAVLAPGVTMEGNVMIGAHAIIESGASLRGPTILSEHVRVGRNAHISTSILWDSVTVGERALLQNVIAGNAYTIASDATLMDAIVANEEVAPA